jgi:hypothetical protein
VGRDPDLFNYFLPERWRRTPKKQLSSHNQVFRTRTKDDINLVWRVSRMGDCPWLAKAKADQKPARDYGFNSPFEEFAFALQLSRGGARTIYPRAIYMTGSKRDPGRKTMDERRVAALAHLLTPDGEAAVRHDCDYITIWGFWNGPDQHLAEHDGRYYSSVNASRAAVQRFITPQMMAGLMESKASKLARCGLEDLNLKPDHLLISFDSEHNLVLDTFGKPEVRLCNFELVRPKDAPPG